jgi:hypothetical protein
MSSNKAIYISPKSLLCLKITIHFEILLIVEKLWEKAAENVAPFSDIRCLLMFDVQYYVLS